MACLAVERLDQKEAGIAVEALSHQRQEMEHSKSTDESSGVAETGVLMSEKGSSFRLKAVQPSA